MVTVTTQAKKASVLYDGQCPLCLRSVAWLKRLDWLSKLRYVNVRDEAQMKSVNADVDESRLLDEMHLITPSGEKIHSGFRAFRWMAWRLPLLMPVAPFLYIPGVPYVGQRVYLWVARNRFRLVPCHGGVCEVPGKSPETKGERRGVGPT